MGKCSGTTYIRVNSTPRKYVRQTLFRIHTRRLVHELCFVDVFLKENKKKNSSSSTRIGIERNSDWVGDAMLVTPALPPPSTVTNGCLEKAL